jgi:selenocysteine lyase/cysteine desulfurase
MDAADANRVVFTYSGTDSLNTILYGVLRSGDHVITTQAEHNSVLRPLRFLERTRGLQVSRVPVDRWGRVDPEDIRREIGSKTKLIALIHASNVTGTIQPVEEIGRISREHDLLFLLDAAQSLGHVELSVESIGCDALAAPGHKGLFGPTGTGVLYVGPRTDSLIDSFRHGGTGSNSESDLQPNSLPDKFEAGNHNVPGLVGLAAGVDFVLEQTVAHIHEHESKLVTTLADGLREIPGIRLFGSDAFDRRVGVVSFQASGYEPQELAAVLDSLPIRVQGRSGFQCAPLIHRAIGSSEGGGTFRLSVSALTTPAHIEQALKVIRTVVG